MGPLFLVGISLYILFFFFCAYACFIADPNKSNLARLLTRVIPSHVLSIVERLFGAKVKNTLSRAHDYLLHERNPAMMILYLNLVVWAWGIMFFHGYPYIPSRYLGRHHRYGGYVVFVLCLASFHKAKTTPPGRITAMTLSKYDNYPYDNLLYAEGRVCPTVGIRRLPRSKYDRMTKGHVPRFDHYCAWLDQTVGEENYRYFLTFVFVQFVMCTYGAIAVFLIFKGEVKDKDLFKAKFVNMATGNEVHASFGVVINWLFHRHFYLSGNFLLLSVMAFVLLGFLGFHLYLTSQNMTTNEFFKWRDVKRWHDDVKQAHKRTWPNMKPDKTANRTCTETLIFTDEGMCINRKITRYLPPEDDVDVGCTGASLSSSAVGEPTKSKNDKKEKDDEPTESKNDKKEEGKKESLADLIINDPGPMPPNMYNMGLVENIKEVFFPRCLRKEAIHRWHAELMAKKDEALRSKETEMKGNGLTTVDGKAKES